MGVEPIKPAHGRSEPFVCCCGGERARVGSPRSYTSNGPAGRRAVRGAGKKSRVYRSPAPGAGVTETPDRLAVKAYFSPTSTATLALALMCGGRTAGRHPGR